MSKLKDIRRPTLAVIEENSLPENFNTLVTEPDKTVTRKLLDENDNVCSHLNLLKEKTAKLNLSTRRPSYVTWKNECIEDSGRGIKAKLPNVRGDNCANGNELTLDKRIDNIDGALVWIKQELVSIIDRCPVFSHYKVTLYNSTALLLILNRRCWDNRGSSLASSDSRSRDFARSFVQSQEREFGGKRDYILKVELYSRDDNSEIGCLFSGWSRSS